MNGTERQRHEWNLRLLEVRAWAYERDLELLTGDEPAGAREDWEREIAALREAVEEERTWLAAHPQTVEPAGGAPVRLETAASTAR